MFPLAIFLFLVLAFSNVLSFFTTNLLANDETQLMQTSYSWRDDFNYESLDEMEAAGWKIGNKNYASVEKEGTGTVKLIVEELRTTSTRHVANKLLIVLGIISISVIPITYWFRKRRRRGRSSKGVA